MMPRMPKGRPRAALFAAVPVLAVLVALALRPARNERFPLPEGSVPSVTQGTFRTTLVLTGSLKALRSEELKVPVTETYRVQIKWMVKEGETVKPGDPVVRFDTAGLASSIETAQDSLKAKAEEKARKQADDKSQRFELDVEVKKAENDNRQKSLDASIPEGI